MIKQNPNPKIERYKSEEGEKREYLKDKSVEEKPNRGKEKRKKGKKREILIRRERFMLPIDWTEWINETHLRFWVFWSSGEERRRWTDRKSREWPVSFSLSLSLARFPRSCVVVVRWQRFHSAMSDESCRVWCGGSTLVLAEVLFFNFDWIKTFSNCPIPF